MLACAEQVAVCVIPAAEIDRRGLHRSNLAALERVLRRLQPVPEVCLTDGFALAASELPSRRVIGGDGRSAAIAAASIVAKVTRDRLMHRMAAHYPGYGFESHVGYITPEHTRAVREHGPTPLHRRSFAAMAYEQLGSRTLRYGRLAELAAAWLLRVRGYRVIGRNLRVAGRELDIVARRRGVLVVCEVKARRHADRSDPCGGGGRAQAAAVAIRGRAARRRRSDRRGGALRRDRGRRPARPPPARSAFS